MRTTLDLDEKLIDDLLKATGAKSKKEAITLAAKEYLRRQCVEDIKKLRGKIQFDLTWEQMEEEELVEYENDR